MPRYGYPFFNKEQTMDKQKPIDKVAFLYILLNDHKEKLQHIEDTLLMYADERVITKNRIVALEEWIENLMPQLTQEEEDFIISRYNQKDDKEDLNE